MHGAGSARMHRQGEALGFSGAHASDLARASHDEVVHLAAKVM